MKAKQKPHPETAFPTSDRLELLLGQMLHKKDLVELSRCKSWVEKEFVFRCFQIPEMCLHFIRKKIKHWEGELPYWLNPLLKLPNP